VIEQRENCALNLAQTKASLETEGRGRRLGTETGALGMSGRSQEREADSVLVSATALLEAEPWAPSIFASQEKELPFPVSVW